MKKSHVSFRDLIGGHRLLSLSVLVMSVSGFACSSQKQGDKPTPKAAETQPNSSMDNRRTEPKDQGRQDEKDREGKNNLKDANPKNAGDSRDRSDTDDDDEIDILAVLKELNLNGSEVTALKDIACELPATELSELASKVPRLSKAKMKNLGLSQEEVDALKTLAGKDKKIDSARIKKLQDAICNAPKKPASKDDDDV